MKSEFEFEEKDIILSDEISDLSEEMQSKFYKEYFENQHCERCSNEVSSDWTLYDNELYCNSCFEFKRLEEIQDAKSYIENYEKLIRSIKKQYSELNKE